MSTEKINKKQLSKLLASLAREHGLSSGDIAKKIGVHRQAVTNWLSGTRTPNAANLKAIADMFGLRVSDLVKTETLLTKGLNKPHVATTNNRKASLSPSPPPESTKTDRPILSGTVHRERRSPWHPDPRKNELLRMAAYILEVDDPEITPAFEQEIIKAHRALVEAPREEPQPKKAANQP